MIDRLDITGYVIDGVFHFIPNSSDPEGSVVMEMPPETCRFDAPDEEIGAAIIRAAERCREGYGLVGTSLDDTAKALGFRSNAAIDKKLVPIGISRRKGAECLNINPMRREKHYLTWTEENFPVPISNTADLGRFAKEAAKISGI